MHQPPPEEPCQYEAARIELSPWLAAGGGVRVLPGGETKGIGTLAIDAGFSLPVAEHLRLGGFIAPGTSNFGSFDASLGPRIELQTNSYESSFSKLFNAPGRYTFVIDGGVGHRFGPNDPFFVTRIAFGFTAPNHLDLYGRCECRSNENEHESSCRPKLGLVSGARPYLSLQRSFAGGFTEVTLGLEFETVGAGWWLAGAAR
ncbi:MAG: hypothetical protein ACXWP4_26215 [Polyangiales bacterium]